MAIPVAMPKTVPTRIIRRSERVANRNWREVGEREKEGGRDGGEKEGRGHR